MKKLITAGAVLALVIPSVALAAASLKVSPTSVKAGGVLKMSGKGCKKGKTVVLLSKAFKGLKHGIGRVTTKAKKGGKFSAKTTIPKTRKAGSYMVTADCGTKTLATKSFTVMAGTVLP